MDPNELQVFKLIIVLTIMSGTGLGAFWLWLRAKSLTAPDRDDLLEEVRADHLKVQSEILGRLNELEERVDFTERRLVQGNSRDQIPPPSA